MSTVTLQSVVKMIGLLDSPGVKTVKSGLQWLGRIARS